MNAVFRIHSYSLYNYLESRSSIKHRPGTDKKPLNAKRTAPGSEFDIGEGRGEEVP